MASDVAREDEIAFGWKLGVFAGLAVLAVAWAPFWGMDRIPFTRCGATWTTPPRSTSSGNSASRGC